MQTEPESSNGFVQTCIPDFFELLLKEMVELLATKEGAPVCRQIAAVAVPPIPEGKDMLNGVSNLFAPIGRNGTGQC